MDAHYRLRQVGLPQALAAAGAISVYWLASNCQSHFDHRGGNPLLGQCPVLVQAAALHR
jgi:hypothetical protein